MDVDISGASVSDGEGCGTNGEQGNIQNLGGNSSKLKRSSSAPMINQLVPQGPVSAPPTFSSTTRETNIGDVPGSQPRVRRFSDTFGPVSPLSPGSSRTSRTFRVCQLREEEGMDVVNRETLHEKAVVSTVQLESTLSQSWEDLRLADDGVRPKSRNISGGNSGISGRPKDFHEPLHGEEVRPKVQNVCGSGRSMKDYTDPLHLTIGPPVTGQALPGCAASPTRGVGRQCFSPSLQQTVRNTSFCPSPSPTKKTFTTRRSLSPIALRPSPLGQKRKWEEANEPFLTPNKRASMCSQERCGGLLIAQPHSLHSLESTPSPVGGGGGSLGSVGTPLGTPDSVCSSGSPQGLLAPPYSPASLAPDTPANTPDPPLNMFKPVSPPAHDQCSSFTDHRSEQMFISSKIGRGRIGGSSSCDNSNPFLLGATKASVSDSSSSSSSNGSNDAMITEDSIAPTVGLVASSVASGANHMETTTLSSRISHLTATDHQLSQLKNSYQDMELTETLPQQPSLNI